MKVQTLKGEDYTPKEVALFQEKHLEAFKQLAGMMQQKKEIEAAEKKAKAKIQELMDQYGIKSISNEFITITRVAAGADKLTIDLDAFSIAEPENYAELLKDYPKTVAGKAGYVKFAVK